MSTELSENAKLEIGFSNWVYHQFAPSIASYCDILLTRIDTIFNDLEGEQRKATDAFLAHAESHFGDDYDSAVQAAFEYSEQHILHFMQMRPVFLTTGVSGLFHLFEKQLYRHLNKELGGWLEAPICRWSQVADDLLPYFKRKVGRDNECFDLVDAFQDKDLQELINVANAVKHGTGGAYNKLLACGAVVVSPKRLKEDFMIGQFTAFDVPLSVQAPDVTRYKAAILRFWKLDGRFYAPRSAFK